MDFVELDMEKYLSIKNKEEMIKYISDVEGKYRLLGIDRERKIVKVKSNGVYDETLFWKKNFRCTVEREGRFIIKPFFTLVVSIYEIWGDDDTDSKIIQMDVDQADPNYSYDVELHIEDKGDYIFIRLIISNDVRVSVFEANNVIVDICARTGKKVNVIATRYNSASNLEINVHDNVNLIVG